VKARLASGNRHKLAELQHALPGWELAPLDLAEYPPETGSTYEENARAKARVGRRHASPGEWVLGEDSGLEAEGLGGRPGIESARWAGDGISRLLAELTGAASRRARYVCTIVALSPEGEEVVVTGTLRGTIEGPPRGSEGFGYDPVFVPDGETRTVADLGNAWKQEHSHRAQAARALAAALAAR
jgi:XTP/dITP diphosphohydrolase